MILRTGIPTVGAVPLSMMGGGAAALGARLRYLLRATFNDNGEIVWLFDK